MTWKPYPTYKASGVEWLGKTPDFARTFLDWLFQRYVKHPRPAGFRGNDKTSTLLMPD